MNFKGEVNMLSAQEARDELKKDLEDRVKSEVREEIELAVEMYEAELSESLSDGVKRALQENLESVAYSDVILYAYNHKHYYYNDNNDLETKYGFRENGESLHKVEKMLFLSKIQEVFRKQLGELIELGYDASLDFLDSTVSVSYNREEKLKGNVPVLKIYWGIEEDGSDAINEEQQAQVRRVEYELNESEDKSVYKKASVEDRVVAQSQSDLKELPKKKKTWWERLING